MSHACYTLPVLEHHRIFEDLILDLGIRRKEIIGKIEEEKREIQAEVVDLKAAAADDTVGHEGR